jgi:hypothetical protein
MKHPGQISDGFARLQRRGWLLQVLGGEYTNYIPGDVKLNQWTRPIIIYESNSQKFRKEFVKYIKNHNNTHKNKIALGKDAWNHARAKIIKNFKNYVHSTYGINAQKITRTNLNNQIHNFLRRSPNNRKQDIENDWKNMTRFINKRNNRNNRNKKRV